MRVLLSWIKEFIPLTLSNEEIAQKLTMSGLEVDDFFEVMNQNSDGKTEESQTKDTVFEISLTPNLNHCGSMMGVARELAAILNESLRLPQIQIQEGGELIDDFLKVTIKDIDLCPRYACRMIKNVKVGPSPSWLKSRLEAVGVRSINNVVDVTNYALLELGHPMHAFDYHLIQNQQIIVRKAHADEFIQTLDAKNHQLKESTLLICDSEKPLAIAGVMGGLNSEVNENTHHIVLEAAYFNPMSIRKTSKQLGFSTDASKKFERGTDPNALIIALDRAAQLIQKVAGGEILKGIIDVKNQEFPEKLIVCRLSRVNQILGLHLSRGEVETIFTNLHFPYEWDGTDSFLIHVPTYRNDISIEIDLIEEVARLYGYDNIPRKGGRFQSSTLLPAPIFLFERQIRSRLIAEGLQELLTCDLVGPSILNVIQDQSIPENMMIKVLNPTSIEQSILRTSLLPGLLQVIKYNHDHQIHDVAGFEIGKIHFRDGEEFVEQHVAGIVLTGNSSCHDWGKEIHEFDFFDLKGMIENLLNELGIKKIEFKNVGIKTLHTGRQASIFIDSLEIGSFGEIHPAIQRRLDVPQRILFGEFNLQDLMKVIHPLEKIKPLSVYPFMERDCTFKINQSFYY
ncbi:MAG: phenylalanine--tRNA ligase subunit beta [Parachlamydiaceae bacterium]|nr:phenylalanine--tRNA ligase subunit beta [Parachlamydiaceae bacterium]